MTATDSNDDNDYDFNDYVEGASNILTLGVNLLLCPSYVYLVTICLIRQAYAEEKQNKKRR
jgi:hypothetical protein